MKKNVKVPKKRKIKTKFQKDIASTRSQILQEIKHKGIDEIIYIDKRGDRPADIINARISTSVLVDNLIDIALSSQDDKLRLLAIKLLLAYIWGEPVSQMEVSGRDGSPLNIAVINFSDLAQKNEEVEGT